jgi:HK97 family phage portal protein
LEYQSEVKSVADLRQMENVSTVFSIVDGISSEIAASVWRLFRGEGVDDPDRVEVKRHAALSVWEHPNPFYTQAEFLEAIQQHYELAGEYWWVLASDTVLNGREVRSPWPLEIWPIRPDRIEPVEDPYEFIRGYVHRLGGEATPLELGQVIFNKRQNPMTPYRGLSPLGSLVYDLSGEINAAKYNAMFFQNGATPGGIITSDVQLQPQDFEQLMMRWREQHRGTSNAHRVGYLEGSVKFQEMGYTRRDMEFVDLRQFSKETIREAWRFPRSMMGSEAASNRATHEAEKQVFADNIIKPRLRRIRESLNTEFLPKFGGQGKAATRRLFFDFDDPSPDDRESQRAELETNLLAADYYMQWGADKDETLEVFELPAVTFNEPEPLPVPPQFVSDEEEPESEDMA